MIEQYFTIIAIIIVLREILGFPCRALFSKMTPDRLSEYSILNRLFKQHGEYAIIIFWLSFLWLIVRYYEITINYIGQL